MNIMEILKRSQDTQAKAAQEDFVKKTAMIVIPVVLIGGLFAYVYFKRGKI